MPYTAPVRNHSVPIYSDKRSKVVYIEHDVAAKETRGYFKDGRSIVRVPDREVRSLLAQAISEAATTRDAAMSIVNQQKSRITALEKLL